MNLFTEILRTVTWSIRVRETALLLRIRQLVTLALVMGSFGTAIGYAVARRGVVDTDDDLDDASEAG